MGRIHANLIIEILGRPPEHIKEAINTIVTKLGSEKGVNLIEKTYHDPKPVENSKDLFTTFAEVELEFENLDAYFGVLFAYMPAHIEIITPDKITLSNAEINELGNRLLQRLHNYDAIAKKIMIERDNLIQKLKEVAPQLFVQNPPEETKKKKTSKKKSKKN